MLPALLLCLILYSCRQAPPSSSLPVEDSVLHVYLVLHGTSPYYDTLSDEYRFLQALDRHDTAYFLKYRTGGGTEKSSGMNIKRTQVAEACRCRMRPVWILRSSSATAQRITAWV